MKKTLLTFLAVLCFAHAGYARDCVDCGPDLERPSVSDLESQLEQLESAITEQKRILVVGAKYGPWGAFDVGDVDLILNLAEGGEIVSFKVKGEVGAFGFNQKVNETMTLEELLVRPLAVTRPGEGEPTLSLSVSPEFNEYGGELFINYRQEGKVMREKLILSEAMGDYGLYRDEVANGQKLERVQLYLGGTSAETIKLKDIKYEMD